MSGGALADHSALGLAAGLPPGDPDLTFDYDPSAAAQPGRVLVVSGTGCLFGGQPMQVAYVRLTRNVVVSGGGDETTSTEYPVSSDGSWSGEFVVPPEFTPGTYLLGASCRAGDQVRAGPENENYVVANAAAPVASAARDEGDASLFTVAVQNCILVEDPSSLTASFEATTASGTNAAATAPVDTSGAAVASLRLPGSGNTQVTVSARCAGSSGALLARPAVVSPVASQQQPPEVGVAPVARTG